MFVQKLSQRLMHIIKGQRVKVPLLGSVGQALKICLLMAVDHPGGIEGLSESCLSS